MKWYFSLLIGFALLFSVFTSCEKFEGGQSIPSYIQVDSFQLVPNPLVELGMLTENFSDVWVYADDQLIGAFELPSFHIPILLVGEHKLTLYPGIEYNGVSGTRGPYLFIEPAEYTGFNFYIDSILQINPPQVKYYPTTQLPWSENFETGLIKLQPTTNSDTSLQYFPYDPIHPKYGNASGAGYLTGSHPILELTSVSPDSPAGIELPANSSPVFLELDYNTNNEFLVGLIIIDVGVQITQHPIVVVTPTGGEWNKIYVNLTPTVNASQTAEFFKVFIRADKSNGVGDAIILLDNVKLIHKDFS